MGSHTNLTTRLNYVDILSAISERGIACSYLQLAEARQLRDNVLGNAVAKVLLRCLAVMLVKGRTDRGFIAGFSCSDGGSWQQRGRHATAQ
jgi:hypothetical protein